MTAIKGAGGVELLAAAPKRAMGNIRSVMLSLKRNPLNLTVGGLLRLRDRGPAPGDA
jgi:hypothetical protein